MRIAVITGASSGMGREMTMLINDTIDIIDEFWLIGRRMERLEDLEKLLTKPVKIISQSLSEPSFFLEYEKMLSEKNPEIVFLVNAAGFGMIGDIAVLSNEKQLDMIDVNIKALSSMCRLSLPYMYKKSRIINFASSAAFLPQAHFAVYAASKSYVLSYSRALNQELYGTGCYVTAVCPGPVKTEFFDIAEKTGQIPVYKRLVMADSKKVVKLALEDSVLKKDISVYGASMKLFHIAAAFPHKILFIVIRLLNKVLKKG